MVLLATCLTATAAQSARVNVATKQMTLQALMNAIEEQTPYLFVLSNDDVNTEMQVSLSNKRGSVSGMLDDALSDTEIGYSISNNYISLYVKEAPAAPVQQQQNVLRGVVRDAAGESVIGAGVVVAGSRLGTITDENGAFSLPGVAVGSTLNISCIGYADKSVVWNGQPLEIVLNEDIEFLTESVVTALGISREKKSLGYAVQDVKAAELMRTGSATLSDALTGKVAGLTINNSGTGAGGSTRVVIRGSSSLSDNSEPLYIVDGVPYYTGGHSIDSQAGFWGGTDRAGGAFDINPDDIESVSVLKGATAAALYGSRAGNGVIMITTKKGGKGGKIGVTYNGRFSWSPIAYYLDSQNRYGQGENGSFVDGSTVSWGAEMKGQSIPAWWDASQTTSYVSNGDPYKQYYSVGNTRSHNLTVQGGAKDSPWRLSIGRDDTQSIVSATTIGKTSADLVSKLKLTEWLSFDVKANYVNTIGNNRQWRGQYSASHFINILPRSISMEKLDQYKFDPVDLLSGIYTQMNYVTSNANVQNPYWLSESIRNKDTQHKFFGMLQMNVRLSPKFSFRVKQGYSWIDYTLNNTYPYNDPVWTTRPSVDITKSTGIESNTEALFTYMDKTDDWEWGASFGGNIMKSNYNSLYGYGRKIPFVGANYISAGTTISASNDVSRKQINSLYAFANIGYKGWVFLDLTARNDWSSSLPIQNCSYFYPSASISILLTEAAKTYGIHINEDIVDYGKLRFSWAKVGKDTDPYQLSDSYYTDTDENDLLTVWRNNNRANGDLKPEMATSWEVGTEWHFFKNRLGLDLTYYSTVTRNQVMLVDYPYSTGIRKKYVNAGDISNKGIELMLNGTFIRKRDFEFGATVNFAKNINKVNTLYHENGQNIDRYSLGQMSGLSGITVYAIEGQPLGDIYGYAYKRDDNGNVIINANGLPQGVANSKIGNINPSFTGSFGLNASYKNITAAALFTFQKGGEIFSVTEYSAAKAGTAKRTEDRSDRVVAGVTESGAANTVSVTAQNYWMSAIDEEFIYDASFLKLAEFSIAYNFDKQFLMRVTKGVVNNASISGYGSNLFYLLKHTPGTPPDGSMTDTSLYAQAFDMDPYPASRTFGFSINIGF